MNSNSLAGLFSSWHLECDLCQEGHPPGYSGRCSFCGGPVIAERTSEGVFGINEAAPGVWQYAAMLGLPPSQQELSLGESMTPLLLSRSLAQRHAVSRVSLKLDYLCPTGSFKDRAVVAGVAVAVLQGAPGIVCASSGNAAASAAAYAARAGLPSILVMPERTPPGKLAASGAYGARQFLVRGDYSESYAVAEQLAHKLGFVNVTTTYANPYGVAALRSVAYDLHRTLSEAADVIVVPTSAGPLVHGVVRGFEDLVRWGRTARVPRVIAAQPDGCAPVVRAWEENAERVREWETVQTGVSGLDDPLRGYAGDGTATLRAVRDSEGAAVAISDEVADRERRLLAEKDGVHAEPAGALGVAALEQLRARGLIGPDEHVVCLLTGSGLKRPLASEVRPLELSTPTEVDHAVTALREEISR